MIQVINIYNDYKNNNSLNTVNTYLRELRARECTNLPLSFIWLGDFNQHHPLWDKERNNHLFTNTALTLTQPLLNMLVHYNMKMALPKDIPMLKASSRVNNMFCSENLLNAVISCDTDPSRWPLKADHYPIITVLDVLVDFSAEEPQPNFQMTDWTRLAEAVG
jgi:endonuclease/exonuclease/phosphatase family metal-dependent hydrolase